MCFSVIVPIYNVEKYVRRCIESVLEQNFEDFELILVDDGSPDKCPQICDEYALKDKRVKVIHKENGGLVSARQEGIKVACGDYIFNLDGDDAMAPGTLETAYEIISKTDADIVCFSYEEYRNGKNGKKIDEPVDEGFYDKEKIEKSIFPKLLSDENMEHIFYYLCGKVIKRSILTKPQLSVSHDISLGEDLSCIVPCYLMAEKVYVSRKTAFFYTIRDDSISTTFKTNQIPQIEAVIKGLKMLDSHRVKDFEEQVARYSCFMCFAILAAAAEGYHFECIKEIKKLILNSIHKSEIKKARFAKLSFKSCAGIFLMKRNGIRTAFYFLYLCKKIKCILRRGGKT